MKKFRGFLLKHRVTSLFRCLHRRNHWPASGYRRINSSSKSLSRILKWVARVKTKAREICYKSPSSRSGYLRFRQDPIIETGRTAVPKGKMAVYVGNDDEDYERVLVPVIYINHPLFGQLLRKAEEEYGHNHPGAIKLPCRISEFENVKTRISAVCGGRKMLRWL
ncbi:auxin-responsive protein SAUR36-like [Rutidosis leptorrhynchoides]|uniref:auxin-responsive protein SAUR36-like n=1 Tax=Rutidosis leptorrhynchoides TaxID=125765 RepID=UPI003A99264B